MKIKFSTHTLTVSAVFVALNIVITRLFSITIDPVRIGFGFLPIALGAMLYGPLVGAAISVVADTLGALLTTGIWWGFTVSAALHGLTYGLFLYRRQKTWLSIGLCVLVQAVLIDTLLGALWYRVFMGMPFVAALIPRGIEALVMIPVKTLVIHSVWRYIGVRILKTL